LRQAKGRLSAWLEALPYRHPRGLEQSLMRTLASCQWISARHTVGLTGPTDIGKTGRACALGPQAGREGDPVRSVRLPRLRQERPSAQGEGREPTRMASLANTDLLLLAAGGLARRKDAKRRDVLDLLEDRHDRRATMVTRQLPVEPGHAAMGHPTLAAAILDRLMHNAYKITRKGAARRTRQITVKNAETLG
jgi:DNA replication protein DnaC